MATPKIEVEIGAKINKLVKSLTDAEGKIQTFGRKATALGKTLSLTVTAPILAIGAAAIKSASDTEESFSKFDTVFRDVSKSAEESFKTLRNEYGLSSLAAKSLLSDTGDLLTGFGFTQKSALDLATEVNKLAVDLASFNNFSGGAEGASKALTSALLGEREAVKALGIVISEEDVKKQVAINTAKGLTFETERQAKAQATLDIAIQQSTNAIGDYNKTSGSFANQTKLLRNRISDLSAEFGQVLLPLATKLASGVASLVNGFTGLDSRTKTIIVAVAGLAAAIGPLSLAIGGIIQALPLLGAGFAALTGPIGLTVAAIAGLAFVVVKNWDLIKKTLDDAGITDVFVGLVDNIKELASVIGGVLVEKFNSSKSSVLGLLEVFKPFLSFVKDQLISNLKFLAEVVSQSFGFISDLIKGDFSTAFLRLEIIVASVSKRIIESIKPLIDFIGFGSQFEQVISNINKKISQNKAIIAGREAFMSYGSAVKETRLTSRIEILYIA